MLKVTFVNGWHDDNKGDSAIVLGTASLLMRYAGSVEWSVVSELPLRGSQDYSYAYRHLKSQLPNLKIAARMVPTYVPKRGMRRYASAASYFARLGGYVMRPIRSTVATSMISECDVVISKGGHMFYAARRWHVMEWANLFSHLYPLLVARKLGKPVVLWGHSLGPFADPGARRMASWILSGAKVVGVRESLSYNVALGLGIDSKKVRLIPDLAFAVQPRATDRVAAAVRAKGLTAGAFLAVTVRQWKRVSWEAYNRYLKAIADVARLLYKEGFCNEVAVVVHTQGPTQEENDLGPSRRLLELLSDVPAVLVDEDFAPDELAAFYGKAKFLLGTRFHSVILSLVGGTPAYAISYFGPKAHGIMRDLGMGDLVVNLDGIDSKVVTRRLLELDVAGLRRSIRMKVKGLKDQLVEATRWLVDEVMS